MRNPAFSGGRARQRSCEAAGLFFPALLRNPFRCRRFQGAAAEHPLLCASKGPPCAGFFAALRGGEKSGILRRSCEAEVVRGSGPFLPRPPPQPLPLPTLSRRSRRTSSSLRQTMSIRTPMKYRGSYAFSLTIISEYACKDDLPNLLFRVGYGSTVPRGRQRPHNCRLKHL